LTRWFSEQWRANPSEAKSHLYALPASHIQELCSFCPLLNAYMWVPLWSSGQSSWLHNGDVLCFLWGTNWIYICYAEESRPPLCLVVRVPGYTTEIYCASCEVRTEFIYVM
jgi:hypothetical protein